jgi:hypothetical protein
MPQYFSDNPLPPMQEKTITCTVRLPEGANPAMVNTKVPITSQDTVNKAIHMLWGKCKNGLNIGVESDYVLKAVGFREYLEGENPIFSYAFVRQCIRDAKEIELAMVKRPTANPAVSQADPKCEQFQAEYMAKVDQKIAPLQPSDYQQLRMQGVPWADYKVIPMAELHVPFRVKICGIDNCVLSALPRMHTKAFQCDTIQVEAFLFHGNSHLTSMYGMVVSIAALLICVLYCVLCLCLCAAGMERMKDSVTITPPIPPSASPRWMQWLNGSYSHEMLISALPRV